MKTLAYIAALSAMSVAAFAAGIDGKWSTEIQMNAADGRSVTNKSTFVLKNEGGVLNGTIESNGQSVAISDGKVDGDKFQFTVRFEGHKGVKTIVYEGMVEGDRMKGQLKVRGIGQTWPFEAKRVE